MQKKNVSAPMNSRKCEYSTSLFSTVVIALLAHPTMDQWLSKEFQWHRSTQAPRERTVSHAQWDEPRPVRWTTPSEMNRLEEKASAMTAVMSSNHCPDERLSFYARNSRLKFNYSSENSYDYNTGDNPETLRNNCFQSFQKQSCDVYAYLVIKEGWRRILVAAFMTGLH